MKKLLEKYGKKKVYIALGSLAAVVVVAGVAIGMSLSGNDNKLELKKDTFVVEYGEEVSLDAKAYIKTDDKEVAKNAKVVIDLEKEKGGKNYVAVGKYKGQVSYEDEKVEFTLKVEDTTKPVFENFPDTLEVQQGCKDDLSTRFQASDLSGVKITVDTSKVDLNTLGEYEMKVTVEDGHGNKTTKTCKVVVREKEETPEKPSNGNAGNGSTNTPAWHGGNNNSGNASNGNNAGSNNNTGGNTGNNGGTAVCTPGTPNPSMIGNSGLWFPNEQAYLKWATEYMQTDDYFNGNGFDAWTIEDTCGNSGVIWTVNWK